MFYLATNESPSSDELKLMEGFKIPIIFNDLDWLKLCSSEVSLVKNAFKQGFGRFSKWKIECNKQYYTLIFLDSLGVIVFRLNKNKKNLLEHFYSEDEAICEIFRAMSVCSLVDELFHFLLPEKDCSCGKTVHTKDCHWLMFPAKEEKFQNLLDVLAWFDAWNIEEDQLALALETYELFQTGCFNSIPNRKFLLEACASAAKSI
jgi:hypothetical protein